MAQNCWESLDHSACSSSSSEDIIVEEIFPGFKKHNNLRRLTNVSKRKVQDSDESSSVSEEIFFIDRKRRKMKLEERFYHCEVCEAYFKSSATYHAHLSDNSHKKALRMLKKTVIKERPPCLNGMVPDESGSRYPFAPRGVTRRVVFDESMIQNVVENEFPACPGLEHVKEIRGLTETIYYCGLCNLTCGNQDILNHLKKRRHLLCALKALSPDEYTNLKRIPRSERKNHLYCLLYIYQEKEGIGRIIVEKDYLDDNDTKEKKFKKFSAQGTSSDNQSLLSHPGCVYPPSSCFCYTCECTMFDKKMFDSHYRAKRPVVKDIMAADLRVTSLSKTESFLVDVLSDKDDPIVGLNCIREFQHFEDRKETYHCFICADCLDFWNIVQHVKSMNHRINYIEFINHYSVDKVRSLDLSRTKSYYIVGEICRTIQRDIGCGCPEVYSIKKISGTESPT